MRGHFVVPLAAPSCMRLLRRILRRLDAPVDRSREVCVGHVLRTMRRSVWNRRKRGTRAKP
jgi:hypothetical protein